MTDGSGPNSSVLWAYYDRATSLWKMSQDCLPLTEDTHSVRSSVTWPTSGMTVNGRCYPLPTWERPTSASASGLWPTPSAQESQPTEAFINEIKENQQGTHQLLYLQGRKWHTQRTLSRVVHTWPTPAASQRGARALDLVENDSTVRRRGSGQVRGIDLETAAKRWPTPTAGDAKNAGHRNSPTSLAHAGISLTDAALTGDSSTPRSDVSGSLNPTGVEWLMGYPSGWTDLEDSGTPSSRSARKLSDT